LAHLFCSLEAIEKSQGITLSDQTKLLRRLAYDGLILRDHALHLYFFVLPDLLNIGSILDIPDDPQNLGHQLLHDSFDIKKVGNDLTTVVAGAAIHAPLPCIGGFLKIPKPEDLKPLADRLEKIRPQIIRAISFFAKDSQKLERNSDYLALRGNNFNFLEGQIVNSSGKNVSEEKFHNFMKSVVIPYSQAEGYVFEDTHEDYLVGSLARLNLNKDLLNSRTQKDLEPYLTVFPSNNIFHNNLAQAIELLQVVDDALDILKNLNLIEEKPPVVRFKEGVGVGVIEAPRGILYHYAKIDGNGMIADYDVIVPTAQNQINIENDLKKYFQENLDKDEETLKLGAEKIIRAYDPCMSCATNFLKITFNRS
jgi:coenzyme F420-reducing hydrogenase alpha subunit